MMCTDGWVRRLGGEVAEWDPGGKPDLQPESEDDGQDSHETSNREIGCYHLGSVSGVT